MILNKVGFIISYKYLVFIHLHVINERKKRWRNTKTILIEEIIGTNTLL